MDISHILNDLNEAQREAVTAPPGPVLVLAGAGSGKTRVLVHRIAWLAQVEGISPFSMLAVTFTNKAAAEMRTRVEQLQGMPLAGIWLGTFHSLAHRMLRTHWQEAGLSKDFQILDADDQYRMVRRVLSSLGLDEARWPPRQAQSFINGRKDEGLRSRHLDDGGDSVQRQLIRIYEAYEQACQRAAMVDFAELLLRSLELLRDNDELLKHYRQRFRYLLVDEFQDTNDIQYAWIRLLAGDHGQVFVVGDDDQAIYGWRGARVENIQAFRKDFPGCRVVRLEQNYRSTGTILKAANALIENNDGRMGKNLWTSGADGDPIIFYSAFNEQDEARFVCERIRQWTAQGHARSEIAILYRSNAQSRVFEERLIVESIPYRVYGGLRFFERAEIKDALAYLRLLNNRDDDASFEREVNQPTRGIGDRSVELLREASRVNNLSLWRAGVELVRSGGLPGRASSALEGFFKLIDNIAADTAELQLHEKVEHVIHASGLLAHYGKEKGEKGLARVENLEELVTAAKGFQYNAQEHGDMDVLTAFLTHAALEAGEGQADAWEDCVQMMTLHSAKGLEFPLVFICGVEEGLFPHQMSLDEGGRLEEERRLCYVGITRARQQLVLTVAEYRRLYGKEHYPRPSRFIREIPSSLIEDIRPRAKVAQPLFTPARPAAEAVQGIGIGQRVSHQKFGEGVVLNFEGRGEHARVQVNFENEGAKWLVLAYAKLQLL